MKKVAIVQRIVPHYRIPFFDVLHANLASQDVELKVVYGQEHPGSVPRSVDVNREWAVRIENRYWHIRDREAVWQPAYEHVKDADLVIIEQANRLLFNYFLLLKRKLGGLKLAFWGHGKNFQSQSDSGFLESWKRLISINVDWWFAYTGQGARLIETLGYDPLKVSVVQNSIDTSALRAARRAISAQELSRVKSSLGITGENIAIYCGGMYEDKKIGFLLEACRLIKIKIPDFHMIFIGEGPDAALVHAFSEKNDWVHCLGAIIGDKRVPYFAVSKLLLMPGLVGLVVLDSFALQTPMVSTDIPIHSPEFEYLTSGYNGLVTAHDAEVYASAVSRLLADESEYLKLLAGCKASADEFTIENMAANFASGILTSLEVGQRAFAK